MTTLAFANWRKSSFSDNDGNCVEIGRADNGTIGVRDSKDPTGPVLAFGPEDWLAFTHHIRAGRFEH